jgi:hypothetical protein
MEMQQIMEMLLKEIKAGQEQMVTKLDAKQERMDANPKKNQEDFMPKLDADRKTDKEEIKTGHKELLAKMEADRKADQEKAKADRKIDKEERKASQANAVADRVQMQELMKMMHVYQTKTDAVLPAMQVMDTSHKETAAVIEPETE